MMNVVTINKITPLFKNGVPAERIELIELKEFDFKLVSQKDFYKVGEKVVYIQPDYNLPDIELFADFVRPGGDPKKSLLGSNNRIRAKRFNFHVDGSNDPVYSNGIILPRLVVYDYLVANDLPTSWDNLSENLGITKYEAPEKVTGGESSAFPSGLYRTDEDNILKVSDSLPFPATYVGRLKVDGSSITIGVTDEYPDGFICSRNQMKSLTYKSVVGKRKPTILERIKMFLGVNVDLNIIEEVDSDSEFVTYGLPYLKKLLDENAFNTVLRGELSGGSLKGSGNKYNPARLEKPNIKFFGSDSIDAEGIAIKDSHSLFSTICLELDLPEAPVIFNKEFSCKEGLYKACNEYFKDNLVEGIVVRTLDSNYSCKIMNLEYDSKK